MKCKGLILFGVLFILLFSAFGSALKSKYSRLHSGSSALSAPTGISIDNGVIDIDLFGEQYTLSPALHWIFDTKKQLFEEEYALKMGANPTVFASSGTITLYYPASGVPGTWYDAKVVFDLDSDSVNDVELTRSVMLPALSNYFYVRYTIKNLLAEPVDIKLYQGADFDPEETADNDIGWYNSTEDSVNSFDISTELKASFRPTDMASAAHSLGDWEEVLATDTFIQIRDDSLNNLDALGDSATQLDIMNGMKWNIGTIAKGSQEEITLEFRFEKPSFEVIPEFSDFALILTILGGAMIGLARKSGKI